MRPVWVEKIERQVKSEVVEWYDYVDAETGEPEYMHLLMKSGEGRAAWKKSDEFAVLGYGGYSEIPVFSPNLSAVRDADRVYLCQKETDAMAMSAIGLPSICVYKATSPKPEEQFAKFLNLVDGKEVVVCPSGDRESVDWKKKVARNVLKDRDFFVLDSSESICGLVQKGREAVESNVKEMIVPTSSEILPASDGFGTGLVDETTAITLQRNINGSVAQTSVNAMEILLKDDAFATLRMKYNELSESVEVCGLPGNSRLHEMTETDLSKMKSRTEIYGFKSKDVLCDAIGMVAEKNSYHPIVEYLESLPAWDGVDRYSELLPKYLGAKRSELVTETTKMLLTSAVKRVFEPGSKYDVCVVFIGDQGLGKSTLCEKLAHGEKYFVDNMQDFGGKAYEMIRGKWFVELAEMKATLSAKSAEEIKQFLSTKQDRHRDVYERLAKDRPRQCVFVGTANNMECLPYDETGNRRFIPIDCSKSRQVVHPLVADDLDEFIEQLWAQALDDYRNGNAISTLDFKFEAELKENTDAHMTQDSRTGVIQDYLDNLASGKVCILQIWREALKEEGFPEKRDSREIGNLMDNRIEGWKNTGKTATFKNYGKKCKYWKRVEFNDYDRNAILTAKGRFEDYELVDGELRKKDGTKPKQMTMTEWEKELPEPSEHNVMPGFKVATPDGEGVVASVEKIDGKNTAFIFSLVDGRFFHYPVERVRVIGGQWDWSMQAEEIRRLL